MLISLKLMKRKNNKVYEEPVGDDIRVWKALARVQAWHIFNLPFCLSTCRIINEILPVGGDKWAPSYFNP